MLLIKQFCSSIYLEDPNIIYSKNIKEVLLDAIKSKFENKCYQGCLIISVLELIDNSLLKYISTRNNSSVVCDVMFKCECISYVKYEILHNCEIKKIGVHAIICKNKDTAVYIKSNKELQTLKEGQLIPVIVVDSRYSISNDCITIRAIPFTPVVNNDVYKMSYTSNVDYNSITGYKELSQKKSELKSKDSKFFTDLVFPYKSELKEWTNTDIDNVLSKKHKYIRFVSFKIMYSDNIDESKYNIIEEDYGNILPVFIQNSILYYNTINGLCDTYPDKKAIKANGNIWAIYEKFRKQSF